MDLAVMDLGYYRLLNDFWILDMMIYHWIPGIQTPWLTNIMSVVTYVGFPLTYLGISPLVSFYLIYQKKILEAVFLNISLFSAWFADDLLKLWFERSRPAGEALTAAAGYSFPSGHAMVSMAFYGFMAFLLLYHSKQKLKWWAAMGLFILVFLVGFSRIYLNVHYTSDVLAGFLFGAIFLIGSIKGFLVVKRRYEVN